MTADGRNEDALIGSPPPMPQVDTAQLLLSLERAQELCSERGLLLSSKWLAELSCAVSSETLERAEKLRTDPDRQNDLLFSTNIESLEAISSAEKNQFVLARSLFECKEFQRCAFVLKGCNSPKCCFLRLYVQYLNIERSKQRFGADALSNKKDKAAAFSADLQFLEQDIEQCIKTNQDDPFLIYLLAAVQKQRGLDHNPVIKLNIKAIKIFPFLWSAWVDLAELATTSEQLSMIQHDLPEHIMTTIFRIYANQELHQNDPQVLDLISQMTEIFPGSLWLKSQHAGFLYNGREYEEAEEIYSDLLKRDPTRIEDLDVYSNILFVQEDKAMLAYIVEVALEIDQFRPETCIILGNYYSLSSEHEKAITFFRRALQLNSKYLAAWTLLGHEYVELKNTHAAIEAYRRALNVNRKDYRAWYGLGQTYEVLEMHHYALYYYQRATALRPYDQRMWSALGNCYEILDQPEEAIKALKRAVTGEVSDPVIFLKIAQIYQKLKQPNEAAVWFVRCIKEEADGDVTMASAKARLWVAREEIKRKNYKMAESAVLPVLDGYYEAEEAKSVLRQIRSQQESQTGQDLRFFSR